MTDFELESTRRSLVMAKGTTVSWRSETALDLVEQLIDARNRIAELEQATSGGN